MRFVIVSAMVLNAATLPTLADHAIEPKVAIVRQAEAKPDIVRKENSEQCKNVVMNLYDPNGKWAGLKVTFGCLSESGDYQN